MEKMMKLCKDGDLETLIKEYYSGTEISGWSIMYIACQEGQLDICKWIFECYPKELYKKSHYNYPVDVACSNNRLNILKWIYEIDNDLIWHLCNRFISSDEYLWYFKSAEIIDWLRDIIKKDYEKIIKKCDASKWIKNPKSVLDYKINILKKGL